MDIQEENESMKIVKKSGGAKKSPGKPNKSGASKIESKKSSLKEGIPKNRPDVNLTGEIKIYDIATDNLSV